LLIDEFFNKSRFSVSKLSDQVEVKPNTLFSLPVYIIDMLQFTAPTTVSAKLIKSTGRDVIELATVVTTTGTGKSYTMSATPATLDWDGTTTLSLKVLINSVEIVVVPLVVKG